MRLVVLSIMPLIPMTLMVMGDPINRVPQRNLLVIFGVCASISGIGGALLTADYRLALGAAVTGLLVAIIVGVCITIIRPFTRRIRLTARPGLRCQSWAPGSCTT